MNYAHQIVRSQWIPTRKAGNTVMCKDWIGQNTEGSFLLLFDQRCPEYYLHVSLQDPWYSKYLYVHSGRISSLCYKECSKNIVFHPLPSPNPCMDINGTASGNQSFCIFGGVLHWQRRQPRVSILKPPLSQCKSHALFLHNGLAGLYDEFIGGSHWQDQQLGNVTSGVDEEQ